MCYYNVVSFFKSRTIRTQISVPVVELDTIKASDGNTQYYGFANCPQYVVISVDFPLTYHNDKKIYTQIYTLPYQSVAL